MLLPYLEQSPLYGAYNFSFSCCSNADAPGIANNTVSNTRLAAFMCPSDGLIGQSNTNNYHGCIGTTTPQGTPLTNGILQFLGSSSLGPNGVWSIAAVRDGSSNTIAFGEAVVGDVSKGNETRANGVMFSYGDPNTPPIYKQGNNNGTNDAQKVGMTGIVNALNACNGAWKALTPASTNGQGLKNQRGQRWANGARAMSLFTTIVPPNSSQYPWSFCALQCAGCAPNEPAFVNANSNHAGGANFAFVDGSVKFIKDSVAMNVYWALGTRDMGETISADSY